MNTETIQALNRLNASFYQRNHESFSATRQRPWQGWDAIADLIRGRAGGGRALRVLDVGCGNMRFERYLLERMPHVRFDFTCVDSCAELVQDVPHCRFIRLDIVESLLQGIHISDVVGSGYDAVVAFGVAHHIPSSDLRTAFVEQAAGCVSATGMAAFSFWMFADDEKLKRKALTATEQGSAMLGLQLETNDYLLGWNDAPGAYRYCHSFTEAEVNDLVQAANVLLSYETDRCNRYVVLEPARGKRGASFGDE